MARRGPKQHHAAGLNLRCIAAVDFAAAAVVIMYSVGVRILATLHMLTPGCQCFSFRVLVAGYVPESAASPVGKPIGQGLDRL